MSYPILDAFLRWHHKGSLLTITALTTLVAYKRYTTAYHGRASDKKIYHWLWHELTALCHPALRAHENICKLKRVAWEDTSVLPILGLEFAYFGIYSEEPDMFFDSPS